MKPVMQAQCPGCKKVLRIPPDWANQPMKCKYCGITIQAKAKTAAQPVNKAVPPANAPRQARPKASRSSAAPAGSPPRAAKETNAGPSASPFADLAPSKPAPPSAGNGAPFTNLDAQPLAPAPKRRRTPASNHPWKVPLLFGGAALALVVVLSVIFLPKLLSKSPSGGGSESGERDGNEARGPADSNDKPILLAPTKKTNLPGSFPNRRALLVTVNNYLYFNPTLYGSTTGPRPHNVGTLKSRLVESLNFPRDQVVVLSEGAGDTVRLKLGSATPVAIGAMATMVLSAKPDAARTKPTRIVIEQALTDFLSGARAQDCVLLLFAGHTAEVGEKEICLVPFDAEPDTKETMIPLKSVLEKLEKCAARQKVLVLDTCRLDPARGFQRPAGGAAEPKKGPDDKELVGAMWDQLDAMLKKPPEGVQIWVSCMADQYSYEFADGLHNGVFLEALDEALQVEKEKIQYPEDPLPMEQLEAGVNQRMKVLLEKRHKAQTSRLSGSAREGSPSYDDKEPAAPRLEVKMPVFAGGMASPEAVQGIFDEISIPPIRPGPGERGLAASDLPLMDAAKLDEYRADNTMGPVKTATLQARQVLLQILKQPLPLELKNATPPTTDIQFKDDVQKQQNGVARSISALKSELQKLKDVEGNLEKTSKRWQANYHYVKARLQERVVYLFEYTTLLAAIRKNEAPNLDAKLGQNGWRMVSTSRMGGDKKESKELSSLLGVLTADDSPFKGTPWEIMAKREKMTVLGLTWEAAKLGSN